MNPLWWAARGGFGAALALVALGPRTAWSQSCTTTSFGTPTLLTGGLNPQFLEVADVNRDGRLDIVAVESGTVAAFINQGGGTFVAPLTTTGPASPTATAVGDFNGDGYADLAVATSSSIFIFMGGATGFTPAATPSYAATSSPASLAVGDFNEDGRLDIVAAGGSNLLSYYRGNGDGTFASESTTTVGFQSTVVRAGDFTGDGRPDVALLKSTGRVAIVPGNGAGGFGAALSPDDAFSGAPTDFVAADFNKDGILDLAASVLAVKTVSVRLGNGDGSFGSAVDSALSNNPQNIVVGEFNGDANPDVAVTHNANSDVDVMVGAGNGTFTPFTAPLGLGGGTPSDLAVGDLNGDGLDDLVASRGGVFVTLNATGGDCVRFLSATSTGGSTALTGQNVLQWVNPSGSFVGVRIRYNTASTIAGCTPPPTVADGSGIAAPDTDFAGPGKMSYSHTGLNINLAYCYSAFVNKDGVSFSGRREITALPFNSTGAVKWGFSQGTASLTSPGNGIGALHAVNNGNVLHSMVKGATGGTWPSTWTPGPMNGPSQGRPSTVPVAVGGSSRVVFLGSQDGHVYAIDAQTGQQAWRSPLLGAMVQAGPSGMFTVFGGNHDYILVGTRNSAADNVFYALRVESGSVAWQFDGVSIGRRIGIISGQATVDYGARRVYFASYQRSGNATDDTVWCLDLDTGGLVWAAAIGNVPGSPTVRGNRVYVGTADGKIHALDTASGAEAWSPPYTPGSGADGPAKGFVAPDGLGSDLYFCTNTTVWKIRDTGAGAALQWKRPGSLPAIPNPSPPVFIVGGSYVYVGSSDGKLYRLSAADGSTVASWALGDGQATVGSPTLDLGANVLYVGTDAGIVYAIQLP